MGANAGAAVAQPNASAQPAAAAALAKRKRKLLPAKSESSEMRSALGEAGDDMPLGPLNDQQAGVAPRRPRRQTQFFRL